MKVRKQTQLQKCRRQNRRLKKALEDVLDMLDEWAPLAGEGQYFGFAGCYAIRQAERLLGRPVSESQ
jgi:hypothetical protein